MFTKVGKNSLKSIFYFVSMSGLVGRLSWETQTSYSSSGWIQRYCHAGWQADHRHALAYQKCAPGLPVGRCSMNCYLTMVEGFACPCWDSNHSAWEVWPFIRDKLVLCEGPDQERFRKPLRCWQDQGNSSPWPRHNHWSFILEPGPG